jgi:hypothetical protein
VVGFPLAPAVPAAPGIVALLLPAQDPDAYRQVEEETEERKEGD